MRLQTLDTYSTASYVFNGELAGIGTWKVADLSPKWLSVCEQLLQQHAPVFRISMGQMLSHIEVKLASAPGAGLGTFYAHGRIVVSTAYFRGQNLDVEQDVMRMFVHSLRGVNIVRAAAADTSPFGDMMQIHERPLHVVVSWEDQQVSEQDTQLVGELANHFAAAYLCRYQG